MSKLYITSDQHFGHKNIIKYENRPFDSVEEMDGHMIHTWNKVVSPEDIIVHLGDISLMGAQQTRSILERLNGVKFLIKGNHDKRGVGWFLGAGFKRVWKKDLIVGNLCLSHVPVYHPALGQRINIHGHSHSSSAKFRDHNKYHEEKNGHRFTNVSACVEHWDYEPVSMERLRLSKYKKELLDFFNNFG